MTDTTPTTKKRGPKPTGNAMSAAERSRRYIQRLKDQAATANPVGNADKPDLERELDRARQTIVDLERELIEARRQHDAAHSSWRTDQEQLRQENHDLLAKVANLDDALQKSDRDCRVLSMRLQGKSNAGIAGELGISASTVAGIIKRATVESR
jgi:ATP/maltotriose-dependent transcriptional regulator MalT